MNLVQVPIDSLVIDPANVRTHGDKNRRAVRDSLRSFGQVEPVVVQKATGRVIGGNCRVEELRQLGEEQVWVHEYDCDDVTATRLAIALNRTSELAAWDDEALTQMLQMLADGGCDIDELGFDQEDLEALVDGLAAGPPPDLPEDGEVTEVPDEPASQPGEIYELGPHRLMCGDSTDPAHVAALLQGARIRLMATDPPYLVNYQGGQHPKSEANAGSDKRDKHWDDYEEQGGDFYDRWLAATMPFIDEHAAVYQWHATRRQALVEAAWQRAGLFVHQSIVWAKDRAVLTHSHLMWQHEPCFYGWRPSKMPPRGRRPPPNETTIWQISQKGEQDGIHPTQKPIELFRRPIRWHLKLGEPCFEPFGGSGSCLIAAAVEGRLCYAMELSPGFCDVIRHRWTTWAEQAHIDPGPGGLRP